jgi:hypothetical protein
MKTRGTVEAEMETEFGRRVWFFPDGDLPPAVRGSDAGPRVLIT